MQYCRQYCVKMRVNTFVQATHSEMKCTQGGKRDLLSMLVVVICISSRGGAVGRPEYAYIHGYHIHVHTVAV